MRRILLLFLLGVAAASPASAATVKLGKTAPAGTAVGCAGCSLFQRATGAASPSYVVPAGGGTITSWSMQGAPSSLSCLIGGCLGQLQVMRPGAGGDYSLVAQSSQRTIPAGKLSTFSTSIPVREGDVLGLLGTNVPLQGAGGLGDTLGDLTGLIGGGLVNVSVGLDPPLGGTTTGGGGSTGGGGGAASDGVPFAGVAVAGRVVRVTRSWVARIAARCPAQAVGVCAGRLVLRSGRLGLGHVSFRIPAGRRAVLNLHVSKKGRKLLRRRGRLSSRASLTARDSRGRRKPTSAALVLKRPRR
ncbi:MAG TPA: hypothetical protein VN606_05560 [Thermoleophilaceae bacterium]|nr:hypothetical protein [Thermoleophilaceae bacterium]